VQNIEGEIFLLAPQQAVGDMGFEPWKVELDLALRYTGGHPCKTSMM
jgi:hypothetical protein